MIVSDLDYLENVKSTSITGSFGIGIAFFGLVEQTATAQAISLKYGDAEATAIATNNAIVNFGSFPYN